MHADHYFCIGQPHVRMGGPCEDYAHSWQENDFSVVAVSDGCGGAFADTDIGARIVTHTFMEQARGLDPCVPEAWLNNAFRQKVCEQVVARAFTPRAEDLYATLVGMVATPSVAKVLVMGDGAIAVRHADGRLHLIEAEWTGNAPCYPAYTAHAARLDAFLADMPADEKTSAFRLNHTTARSAGASGQYEVTDEWSEAFPAETAVQGTVLSFDPIADGIEGIALLSDGFSRMGGVSEGLFHPLHIAGRFMAFKNFRGGFVKRRMIAEMQALARQGHLPGDDTAIACVWFGNTD